LISQSVRRRLPSLTDYAHPSVPLLPVRKQQSEPSSLITHLTLLSHTTTACRTPPLHCFAWKRASRNKTRKPDGLPNNQSPIQAQERDEEGGSRAEPARRRRRHCRPPLLHGILGPHPGRYGRTCSSASIDLDSPCLLRERPALQARRCWSSSWPSTPPPSGSPPGGRPTPTRAAGRASPARSPTSGSNLCAFVARSACLLHFLLSHQMRLCSFPMLHFFSDCMSLQSANPLLRAEISLTCSLAASFRPALGS
jgi:hypothetical protein